MATNSANPFVGAGVEGNTYSLNATNSLVYDMGEPSYINQAWVKGVAAHSTSVYSLYYSDDNQNWSFVSDMSFLYADSTAHFYNLGVHARYLKIATSADCNTVADFGAESANGFLLANGGFKCKTTVEVTNETSSALKNNIVQFTLADLGLTSADLLAGRNDIRFAVDGILLPHYDDGNTFFVRVFDIPANGSTTVSVYYGNANAASVSYGDEVFEVRPEVKTEQMLSIGTWRASLVQCPNGDILAAANNADGKIEFQRSTDGGYTWQEKAVTDISHLVGSFLVDGDKIFMLAFDNKYSSDPSRYDYLYMYCSTDNGKTWVEKTAKTGFKTVGTYTRGVKLSTYDGAGSGVDYVFAISASNDSENQGLFASSLYSTDGGETWQTSNSQILYGDNPRMESGSSEPSIWEQADGTLIMYARNQNHESREIALQEVHFVRAISKDHGVTWELMTGDDVYSNVFAGNTQALIIPYEGKPLLIWAGNNSLGGVSYDRIPLCLAVSNDDGETFENILSLTYGTTRALYNSVNPDAIIYTYNGVEYMLVTTDRRVILIENFGEFLTETKGAYDSFEVGVEGWLRKPIKVRDEVAGQNQYTYQWLAQSTQASVVSDGIYCLQIQQGAEAYRHLPQTFNGTVSLNLYIGDVTGGLELALQSTYHDLEGGTPLTGDVTSNPIYLIFDETGALTLDSSIKLVNGMNRITITFDSQTRTYTLTINGMSTTQNYTVGAEAYVCFFNLWNHTANAVHIDEFILY